MGTTPNLGIEYPDPSGVPSRKTWVEDPIKSVDTQVQALLVALGLAGRRIEFGTTSVPVSGTPSTGSSAVTFSKPFSSAPVMFTSSGNWLYATSWGSVTATGFTAFARRTTDASSSVTSVLVSWIAIGVAAS